MSWTDHDPPPDDAERTEGGPPEASESPEEAPTTTWRPPWAAPEPQHPTTEPVDEPAQARPAYQDEAPPEPEAPSEPERPVMPAIDLGAGVPTRPEPDPASITVPEPPAPPDTARGTEPAAGGPVWTTSREPRGPARQRPAHIIALANQKGGVGKTTTVINLGAGLAELDQRVLLVDMDPQGSLGVGLGAEPHRLERTIYNLLMADGTSPDEVILETTQPGMHVIPANIDLAAAELMLVQEVAREQSLRRVLDRLLYRYDQILIDCPPSLGLLTINGLTAADSVVVPLECEYFALRGMSLLMNTIEKVQGRLNPRLELLGILATMVDTRTLHAREVLERVHEAFGELVFKTTINKTIRFAEAPVAGEPITRYDSENRGADAYRDLAREVLSREPTA